MELLLVIELETLPVEVALKVSKDEGEKEREKVTDWEEVLEPVLVRLRLGVYTSDSDPVALLDCDEVEVMLLVSVGEPLPLPLLVEEAELVIESDLVRVRELEVLRVNVELAVLSPVSEVVPERVQLWLWDWEQLKVLLALRLPVELKLLLSVGVQLREGT